MPETGASPETLMLVDGNNLVYRSFFALPPLANRAGTPTNAVLGLANVLRKLLQGQYRTWDLRVCTRPGLKVASTHGTTPFAAMHCRSAA